MFVKYQVKGGLTDTDHTKHNLIMQDFRDIMNGTHTAASDFNTNVCDVSSSEMVGAANSSIYSSIAYVQSSGSSVESQIRINKRHHYYLTDSNYDMARNVRVCISPNSGDVAGVIVGTKTSTDFRPNNNTSFSTGMTPEVNCLISNSPVFYFYVSDYWFMWQHYDQQRDMASWGGVLDYDVTDHDKYVYDSIDSDYSAQYCWAGSTNNDFNTQQSSTTVSDAEYLGKVAYLANDGNIQSHSEWSTGNQQYAWGYSVSDNYLMGMMFPPNQKRQLASLLGNGDKSHQLVPLYALPHNNDSDDSDSVIARFPYVWRTTDDIGSPGQTITFNGVDYVVMMGNKTGGSSSNDVDRMANACYLFQKTIGGK
jgi:hypothetical protein